ncbi:MAG: hypothetical protein ACXABG_03980, partial [Promethearchaeota archaeon]
ERGIITGEFQHGSISESNLAYNCGEEIIKSKSYKEYLPDYVLTFGDYWNHKINTGSKRITIGNPHFYENIKKYQNVKEQKNSVLIISQGTITDKFVTIAKYLSEKFPSYKIKFKLHPGEVSFENRYKELYNYENIDVIKFGVLYEYVAKSEIIIACYSTAIFETLGFSKKLYILDNEMSRKEIPRDIGLWFKKANELNLDANDAIKTYNPEYFFNPNWEVNYRGFLREEVGIN